MEAWLTRSVRRHFAVVIELLIAVLTQLLLRALIIVFLRSGRDHHQHTVAGECAIRRSVLA